MQELGRKFYEVMDQLDLTELSVIDRSEIEALKFEVACQEFDRAVYEAKRVVKKLS